MDAYIDAIISRGPEQRLPWDPIESTEQALASIEATIKRHHGRGDGRIQVWPSPAVATMASREGLLGAKDLARKYGTMVTGHISESRFDNRRAGVSTIEYLATIGYLDANVLAVHCVHADDNDVRILSRTGTKLSYNPRANMVLGSGFTPVVDMQTQGMITGMGTDNASANNTVNMLADMKILALAQKARYKSAVAITAEKTLEMATIEGARAIGMDKDIGSLEVGKKADIIIIDLSEAHMAPCHSLPSALVYQAMGTEIETVIVDGKILMEERTLTMLEPGEEQHLLDKAQAASDRVVVKAGLEKERAWCSYKTI
ncbi:MAG: amidohydrolase family protein, partial [Pseudomonadales bacterium]